jgi:hypothetical protein
MKREAKARLRRLASLTGATAVTVALLITAGAAALGEEELDPAHNTPLPCELVSTPGGVPRTAKNIAHLANVCGFVGTDVEFQSRTANDGLHDYAFVGTMGAGLRIFDVTDPAHPFIAGQYTDPGWEGDIQVRGNTAVIGFDPIGPAAPNTSLCLQSKGSTGGADIINLSYNTTTATFTTSLRDCVPNTPGGAHNSTLHPSGEWLAYSNPRANGSVDVIDLVGTGTPKLVYRIVGTSTQTNATVCPPTASFTCLAPAGIGDSWTPHDIGFSRDGNTAYVAAVDDGTFLLNVASVLSGTVSVISKIPNITEPGGLTNSHNIEISHQSDVTSDGKIVVITDERGGGLSNTDCNADPNGVIGGMHFWAVDSSVVSGASPATPKKIGSWHYPNPTLAFDLIGRAERACTIHVFRLGGNGTASPGPIQPGFDGVSSLPVRETTAAHYGAGVWHIDFNGAPSSLDGIPEDSRTTWGNTRGWNIMPGAETWSGKEYKGYIYAGDMGRGFDVYRFTTCDGPTCITLPPPNTPGRASGGGQLANELAEMAIVRGTSAGGRASFGFNAQFSDGVLSGHLTFIDHGVGKTVQSTSITSFTRSGNQATFTGTATVNKTPGISFTVMVEDWGEPGSSAATKPDTFKIVLGDGYAAQGVLLKGNIQVQDA